MEHEKGWLENGQHPGQDGFEGAEEGVSLNKPTNHRDVCKTENILWNWN